MTIQQGDIKIVASQVMDDVPEGGGAPTGTIIPDGASNGVFPDISELDRAGGRVNLRLLYGHVRTTTVDGYFGANVIVAEPYADPRVSVSLFAATGPFERRSSAASRLEAYLARGAAYQGYLFGDHLAGQGTILVLQREEQALPGVGDTLVLRKNENLPTQTDEYIRLKSVTASKRTFTDSVGEFSRTLLELELTNPLSTDFPGFDALRYDTSISYVGKTRLNAAVVADASRYYGSQPLATAATLGDSILRVPTIFTQLVPSTRVETPVADARLNQRSAALVDSGAAVTFSVSVAFNASQPLFVGGGILPGSLSLTRDGITLTDKAGTLVNGGTTVGTIDYSNGILRLATSVFGVGVSPNVITYKPAAQPTIVTDSRGIKVTTAGQRLNWVFTLDPVPAKGSLEVSYRALGKWYVLRDDGSGALRGSDSSIGAGTLNYTTGTVSITLGALPDVDSLIIPLWASTGASTPLSSVAPYAPTFSRRLRKIAQFGRGIKPGTLTLSWNDGVARTATDSAGSLTGDAVGTVFYGSGDVHFSPSTLPAKGTVVTAAFAASVTRSSTVASFTDGGTAWTFSLGATVRPTSVEVSVVAQYPERSYPGDDVTAKRSLLVYDDGSGNLVVGNVTGTLVIGTVDYSTGACSINKTVAGLNTEQPVFSTSSIGLSGDTNTYTRQSGFETRSVTLTVLNGAGGSTLSLPAWAWWTAAQSDAAIYRVAGIDGATGQTATFTLDEFSFLLADPRRESYVGGAGVVASYQYALVSFTVGSSRYVASAAGALTRDINPANGEGTPAGSYAGSVAQITSWQVGASSLPSGVSGARTAAASGLGSGQLISSVTSRSAVSPLLQGAFELSGSWVDGSTFTVSADSLGAISTGSAHTPGTPFSTPGSLGVFARVDYDSGTFDIKLGRRVGSDWAGRPGVIDVSSLGLPGVTLIQSVGVQADTLRYNAVGYSYLPLDPEILGLNTVRLPADGRVPIYREGEFVVIGNKQTTSPATVSNGQTINCGRVRLSRVRVVGNDGGTIASGFSADLDAGTVTFSDVTGYSQPVSVEHRIEDMALLSDVQINGQLSITRPVTHNYPTTGTYVSSALIIGDVKARVSLVFDQQSWGNVWQDTVNGSTATGTFNDAAFPIVVTNSGALTERWACVFKSNNTSYDLIGEHVGVVGTGSVNADYSPTNPATGQPYMTIPSNGWGSGWSAGNVMRFNTIGAIPPFWTVRTILQGPETVVDDKFTLLLRGDVDRP